MPAKKSRLLGGDEYHFLDMGELDDAKLNELKGIKTLEVLLHMILPDYVCKSI
jgi:hypothetical protein